MDAPVMDLDRLIGHIVREHHAYIRAAAPELRRLSAQLAREHGHDCLAFGRLSELVSALDDELTRHLTKEENILFPFINELAAAERAGDFPPVSPFGTLANPVRVMESDHQHAFTLVEQIGGLTSTIVEPPAARATYREFLERQAKFDAALREHVALEDHVLFPRAIELEARLG